MRHSPQEIFNTAARWLEATGSTPYEARIVADHLTNANLRGHDSHGVGMIAMSALFSLITLPVEYNASARALEWLQTSRTMEGAQLAQAREALSWAARTYLVAALSAIASVLYYVLLILGGRRD